MRKQLITTMLAAAMSINVAFAGNSVEDRVRDAAGSILSKTIAASANLDSLQKLNLQAEIDSIITAEQDAAVAYTIDMSSDTAPLDNFDAISMTPQLKEQKERNKFFTRILAITAPFISIIIIVALCLLYNYKKRTAKYAMIEKAIDNNYTIPEYLIKEQPVFTAGTPFQASKRSVGSRSRVSIHDLYANPLKWKDLRTGSVLVAVGVGVFFAFGFGFMGAMASILILIGASKIVSNYLQVRDMDAYIKACSDDAPQEVAKPEDKSETTPEPPAYPGE